MCDERVALIINIFYCSNNFYLNFQIQGSKTQAEEGTLIILAAGDRSLFDDCQSCFKAMSKNSFYLGSSQLLRLRMYRTLDVDIYVLFMARAVVG